MNLHNTNLGILILRFSLGILMIFHGISKVINGVDGLVSKFSSMGLPGFIAYGAYLGEFVAPILIIIGFRTRIAAFFLSTTMLIAICVAHSADIFTVGKGGGWAIELPAMYLLAGIVLMFTGAGNYSVSRASKWD